MGLNLFTLKSVYSTVFLSRVSPSPHYYTLSQTEPFFLFRFFFYQSYAPSPGSLVGYVDLLMPCTFAPILGTHLCSCHKPLPLTSGTLVHTHTSHLCPYSKDHCPCLRHSTIPHTTNGSAYYLLGRFTH